MRALFVFSNPPGLTPIRLDKEDRVISQLAKDHAGVHTVDRQHASEVEDVHALVTKGNYDVIHFSGHGDQGGLYLDKSDFCSGTGELVSAKRLLSLLELANKSPQVVALLCCYSDDALDLLANAAPFVVTSKCAVLDAACVIFTKGFYEHLFSGNSVQGSFQHAQSLLTARGLDPNSFRLSRRSLIKRGSGVFIESTPDPHRDSILVNLDSVKDRLGKFGMTEEELCHMLARKLRVHSWIFDGANDHAIIPVGRMLFGEFTWKNAREVVFCTRLMKIRPDVPRLHWELWSRILTSYNDLAACAFRSVPEPADPARRSVLQEGIMVFNYHIDKYLKPALGTLEELGYGSLVPHAEWAVAAAENAEGQFKMGRYPQTVSALEMSLTNFHEVANGLLPPEEVI